MKSVFHIMFLMVAATMLFSCNKDEDPTANLSKEELIAGTTSKAWNLTKTEIVGLGSDSPEACSADDTHTFSRDGAYSFDEGGSKCEEADPQTTSGSWRLNEDKTEFIRGEGGIELTSKIISLNNSTMVLETNFLFLIRETYSKK